MAHQDSAQNETIIKARDSAPEPSKLRQEHFEVTQLPGRTFVSPLVLQKREFVELQIITDENLRIMYDPRPQSELRNGMAVSMSPLTLKLACPRKTLHFNPRNTVVGIVTCGGLCPGLNDVIRGLTLTSINSYHVKKVVGFRYGYWGLSKAGRHTAIELTADSVRDIQTRGGTALGTSRGGQKVADMVDTLVSLGVNILFTVGGDGTQKGALAISKECERRGLDIAVVGIPKTIDNDLSFSHRTFGFETAVDRAVHAIRAAYSEASSHEYGIGVVKLMGRDSGFIAAQATVSSGLTNICLIPEMPISKDVFLQLLRHRLETKKYCVVVVAEGFGQNWPECTADLGTDASGNRRLADIGVIIKKTCEQFHKSDKKTYGLSTVKYIDPSYMIRACVPISSDVSFCSNLATLAVHEAMAGCTGCLISQWFSKFVLVPIALAVSLRKVVTINGPLWRQVREVTVDLDSDNKDIQKKELKRDLDVLNLKRSQVMSALAKL